MKEKIKNRALPLLFGSSVAYMIIDCYHHADALLYTVGFFVYSLVLFIVFDLIRRVKKVSWLLYLALAFGVMYFTVYNAMSMHYGGRIAMSFNQWFYGAQTAETVIPAYSVALIIGGGFFLVSVLYYFTQIIYRGFGTLFIMLFPLVIYAKRLDEIELLPMLAVLFFYIAILVHNRQMKADKNAVVVLNRSYLVSIGLFVVAVIVLTALFPRPNVVSKQEKDSGYFDSLASKAPDSFSNTSSASGGMLSDEIIMYVKSDRPLYLRRESYDYYSGGAWHTDTGIEQSYKIPNDWGKYVVNTSNASLVKALSEYSEAQDENSDVIMYPKPEFDFPASKTVSIEMTDDFTPWFVLAPLNAYKVEETTYKRCIHGEFRPLANSPYERYRNGYEVSYYPVPGELYELCESLDITLDDQLSALQSAILSTERNSEEYNKLENLLTETEFVRENVKLYDNEVPSKLAQLAEKITSGLSAPYEKAKALEGYFTEENFEYDPEYSPFDDSIENFVFDSKKGACGDFATAMTLMAKSVGLKARYVEGFVVAEQNEDLSDLYIVRSLHSHAYVEIYIPGAGWLVFEPTVPGFLDYSPDNDQETDLLAYFKTILIIVVPTGLALFLIFVFRRQISELIFSVRLIFCDNNKTVILCFNRLVKKLSYKTEINTDCTSVKQFLSLVEINDEDVYRFAELFEKVCYGNHNADGSDKKFYIDEYKRIKRCISSSKP